MRYKIVTALAAAVVFVLLLSCSVEFSLNDGGSEIKNPVTHTDGQECNLDTISIIIVPRD